MVEMDFDQLTLRDLAASIELELAIRWSMLHQKEHLLCLRSIKDGILNDANNFDDFNEDEKQSLVDAVFNSVEFCSNEYFEYFPGRFDSDCHYLSKIEDFLRKQHGIHRHRLSVACDKLTAVEFFNLGYLARDSCIEGILYWLGTLTDEAFRYANCLGGKISSVTDLNSVSKGGTVVIYQMPCPAPKLKKTPNSAYSVQLDEQGALSLCFLPNASLDDLRSGIGELCRQYASLQLDMLNNSLDAVACGDGFDGDICDFYKKVTSEIDAAQKLIDDYVCTKELFRKNQFESVILGLICWDFCKNHNMRVADAVQKTCELYSDAFGGNDPNYSKDGVIENAYSKIVSFLNREKYSLYFN